MDIRNQPLLPGSYFHIFNRGQNSRKVFFERENCRYFLQQYERYVGPFVRTYAYCLLSNHFHFLVQIREEEVLESVCKQVGDNPLYWYASNAFASWLKSYTQAVNKRYKYTGAIFEKPFKRIEVKTDEYFTNLVTYIHHNPVKHGIRKEFQSYPFSSYQTIVKSNHPTNLERERLLDWFGGLDAFVDFHRNPIKGDSELYLE